MSKAKEFAYSKYPKYKKGVLYDLARNSIIQGYNQAEKDLELTLDDIKQICDIAFEEACRLQRNMKGSLIYKEQHYQEVLNRFKCLKHVK